MQYSDERVEQLDRCWRCGAVEETGPRMWTGLLALPLLLLYTLPAATQAESVGEKILRKIGRPALLHTVLGPGCIAG